MSFNISDVSTTKMTSKGQVVIPEEIREYMNLESGVKFLVMATTDSIIFKKIHPIPQEDIRALLENSNRIAKEQGITKKDIAQAIADVRAEQKLKPTISSQAKAKPTVRKKINPFTGEPVARKIKSSSLHKTKNKKTSKLHAKRDKSSK